MAICWLRHWNKKYKEIERTSSKFCYSYYHFRNKFDNMHVVRMAALPVKLGIKQGQLGSERSPKVFLCFQCLSCQAAHKVEDALSFDLGNSGAGKKESKRPYCSYLYHFHVPSAAWVETGIDRSESALCGRWVGLGTQMRQQHHQRCGKRTTICIFSPTSISWPEITHYLWQGRTMKWRHRVFAGLSPGGAAVLCKPVKRTLKACSLKMQAISMLKNIHIIQIVLSGIY